MNNIETHTLIPIELFDTCKICGTKKNNITEMYPTRQHGAYYLDKFINFLKDNHKIDIKSYCKNYLNIDWPKCPASNEEVGYQVIGKGIKLSKFKRGKISKDRCPKFAEACRRFSQERLGENNPMYGVSAWNKGKDKRNPIIRKMAEANRGKITSPEVRKKQSESAKKRLIHGHTGIKHSKKSKEKIRIATAKRYQDGLFKRESGIHIKMREFLNSLSLKETFSEEHQVKYFSLDFAFPLAKVGIECQGTYYHVDPRIYPNGPKDAIQRRNFGRDRHKHKFLKENGWKVIECWETEINDGSFKSYLIGKLKSLYIL